MCLATAPGAFFTAFEPTLRGKIYGNGWKKINEMTLHSHVSSTLEGFLEILLTLFPFIQFPRYLEIVDQITGLKTGK